jgi:chromosome partitioning protein
MALVITVASSKGGVGKTLTCQVLAGRLATEEGMRVAAIDADPNRALAEWHAQVYEGPPFVCQIEADAAHLAHLIPEAAERADVLLIDTAGFGNQASAAAMASADGVLVPTMTGRADVAEATKTVKLAEGLARGARREIPVRVLANRIKRAAVARHALAGVEAAGLPRLATALSDVVGYIELSHTGRLPKQPPASLEVEALVDELRCLGWLPPQPRG